MSKDKWMELVFINCAIGLIAIGCGTPNCGLRDGRLMPCPKSPNCVSSYATDAVHTVDSLTYQGTRENARNAVLTVLDSMPRVTMVKSEDNYIHAEFRSKIFRFVDDVEFQFVDESPVVHVRSASRLGYSDLGVNKKRIDEIRKMFNRKLGLDLKQE